MRYLPPRRWFQFRLSTWFVLVAIVAELMVSWPWVIVISGNEIVGEKWVSPNSRLRLPISTVLLFLAWKAAWASRTARITKFPMPL
jgi:hypothetical protein